MAPPPERPGLLRPLWLTALLSLCAFALPNLLWPRQAPPAPPEQAQRVALEGKEGPGPAILMAATPEAVLERFDAAYRLEPDRRFLAAAGEVDELLGLQDPAAGTARFEDGSWVLSTRDGQLARVGELPAFRELFAFVEAVVARRAGAGHVAAAAGGPVPDDLPADPMAALTALDALPGAPDWAAAAHAYASLLLAHDDPLETADEVAARALAVLALGEHAAGGPLLRARIAIAHRLGYEREASEWSSELRPGDPLRPWATRDPAPLREWAIREDVSPTTALLYAQVLATGHHREAFIRYEASLPPGLRTHPGMLALAARYGAPAGPDQLFLFHALRDLAEASGAMQSDPRLAVAEELVRRLVEKPPYGLVGHTEAMLDRLASRPSGRLFDSVTRAAVHRARVFSAIERVGNDLVDRLATREGSEAFAAFLGAARDGAARDFVRYFDHLLLARAHRLSDEQRHRDFEELERFGPVLLRQLLGNLAHANPEPERMRAAASLIQRADTRIEHRELMHDVVLMVLLDLVRAEALGRSVLREWPRRDPYRHAWYAILDGDAEGLMRWLSDPSASSATRAAILPLAVETELLDEAAVRRTYEELLARDPADWSVVERYADHLEERQDWPAVQSQVEAWLARSDRRGGMPELDARTTLARALHAQGRRAEAWLAIQAPLAGSYGGAFHRAARIRLDQDRLDDAEQIARAGLDRYPGSVFLAALLARVQWRRNDFGAAAAALADAESISWMSWRHDVGPEFVAEFAGAPEERVEAAVAALEAAGFHPKVREELAIAADREDDPALAFRLVQHGHHPHLRFRAYEHLERWKGRDEALDWLDAQLPKGPRRSRLAMFAFEARRPEVLWDLVPDPATRGPVEDYLWLTRAASWVRDGSPEGPWRSRLEGYYASTGGSYYDRIGAMLLGRLDEQALWAAAERIDQRVEAAYFIALRAEAQGDLERAVSWYRATLEAGLRNEGESHWSLHQLSRLRSQRKSLARLAGARI